MIYFLCRIKGTCFRVIVDTEEQVELSFTRMWDPSLEGKFVPLNIDKRSLLVKAYSNFVDKERLIRVRFIDLISLQVYNAPWFLGLLLLWHL